MEAKFTDKPNGKYYDTYSRIDVFRSLLPVKFGLVLAPSFSSVLIFHSRPGLTFTQSWNTFNALDAKLELKDNVAKGLKAELLGSFLPATQAKGGKVNLFYTQNNFSGRAFFDLLKGPTANVDAVIGHEGFLVGASAGYDVQKAAITSYSAALGYSAASYSATVTAANNLSVFSAAYYHKVNADVQAAAKASWDSKTGGNPSLEVAGKYKIDAASFAKVGISGRVLMSSS